MKLKHLILGSLAGAATTAAFAQTPVTVTITGSTAFRDAAFDRAAAILTGETLVSAGSNVKSYTGGSITIGGTLYSPVTINFSQTGSGAGLQALVSATPVTLATGGTGVAQASFSDVFPATAGNNNSFFNITTVGVIPFVLVYNSTLSPTMNFGSLNQRQLTYLFAASGDLPTAYFGGTGATADTDIVYLVGRNSESGSRLATDACAYFTGNPANYQWSAGLGAYIASTQPLGGWDSGSKVRADLLVGAYGIGYVSPADSAGLARLNYNGVAQSNTTVQKGSYELWSYGLLATAKAGTTKPTAEQLAIITALANAIKDPVWQNTVGSDYQVKGYVPLDGMEVSRTSDGGQIKSTVY